MGRGDLTEAEWRVLKDLLPIDRKNRGRGRPPEQNRSTINGILWRLPASSFLGIVHLATARYLVKYVRAA